MADLDLDELERLLAEAAPSPWHPYLIAVRRERDRLRALCREAAGYMSARPMHPLSAEADLYERLRTAGVQ